LKEIKEKDMTSKIDLEAIADVYGYETAKIEGDEIHGTGSSNPVDRSKDDKWFYVCTILEAEEAEKNEKLKDFYNKRINGKILSEFNKDMASSS
jgi:hypothetical protein